MVVVTFPAVLQRHIACPPQQVAGGALRDVIERACAVKPALRGYVLDEHGALRQHMAVFIDGVPARDRVRLSDVVHEAAQVHILQALSGG